MVNKISSIFKLKAFIAVISLFLFNEILALEKGDCFDKPDPSGYVKKEHIVDITDSDWKRVDLGVKEGAPVAITVENNRTTNAIKEYYLIYTADCANENNPEKLFELDIIDSLKQSKSYSEFRNNFKLLEFKDASINIKNNDVVEISILEPIDFIKQLMQTKIGPKLLKDDNSEVSINSLSNTDIYAKYDYFWYEENRDLVALKALNKFYNIDLAEFFAKGSNIGNSYNATNENGDVVTYYDYGFVPLANIDDSSFAGLINAHSDLIANGHIKNTLLYKIFKRPDNSVFSSAIAAKMVEWPGFLLLYGNFNNLDDICYPKEFLQFNRRGPSNSALPSMNETDNYEGDYLHDLNYDRVFNTDASGNKVYSGQNIFNGRFNNFIRASYPLQTLISSSHNNTAKGNWGAIGARTLEENIYNMQDACSSSDNEIEPSNNTCAMHKGLGFRILNGNDLIKADNGLMLSNNDDHNLVFGANTTGNLKITSNLECQTCKFKIADKEFSGLKNLKFGTYFIKVKVDQNFFGQPPVQLEAMVKNSMPTAAESGVIINESLVKFIASQSGEVYIRPKPNLFDDVSGTVQITASAFAYNPVFSNYIKLYVVDPMLEKFSEASELMFKNAASSSFFQNLIKVSLTIYVALYGLFFMLGATQIKHSDLVARVIKIAILYALLREDSWKFFNSYFFTLFRDGSDELISKVLGLSEGNNFFYFIDEAMGRFFNSQTWLAIMAMIVQFGVGWFLVALILIIGMIMFLLVMADVIIGFLLSYFAIALLIAMAPLFLVFMLFSQTRAMFTQWMKLLFGFMLKPVILIAIIAILHTLIINNFYQAIPKVCFDEWLDIELYLSLAFIGIDKQWSFTLATIDFFVPENAGDATIISALAGALTFTVICLIANRAYDFADNIANFLMNTSGVGDPSAVKGQGMYGGAADSRMSSDNYKSPGFIDRINKKLGTNLPSREAINRRMMNYAASTAAKQMNYGIKKASQAYSKAAEVNKKLMKKGISKAGSKLANATLGEERVEKISNKVSDVKQSMSGAKQNAFSKLNDKLFSPSSSSESSAENKTAALSSDDSGQTVENSVDNSAENKNTNNNASSTRSDDSGQAVENSVGNSSENENTDNNASSTRSARPNLESDPYAINDAGLEDKTQEQTEAVAYEGSEDEASEHRGTRAKLGNAYDNLGEESLRSEQPALQSTEDSSEDLDGDGASEPQTTERKTITGDAQDSSESSKQGKIKKKD